MGKRAIESSGSTQPVAMAKSRSLSLVHELKEFGRRPLETKSKGADEVNLARRLRHAVNNGTITTEQFDDLAEFWFRHESKEE